MTCDTALELLLDADPAELDGNAVTPLGGHLRECARCRRVAIQLVRDTRAMALAVRGMPVRRPSRRAVPALVPAFALAALVVAVVLWSGREGPLPVSAPVIEQLAAVAAAPVDPPGPTAAVAASEPTVRSRRSQPARAFAPAVAFAAVKWETLAVASPSPVAGASNTVTVSPPEGTRATVMQTSNPKLVVVWLH